MSEPLRVVILNDTSLIYSDDYRDGWIWGFQQIGCDVKVVDVGHLSKLPRNISGASSPYSTTHSGRAAKMLAQNIVQMRPQLVFTHHGRASSHPDFIAYIRRTGSPTAVYLCDEPYECGETCKWSPFFDHVFTMDPCTMQLHRDVRIARGSGGGVHYLPPGVNTDRFRRRADIERTTPALFLGNASLPPRPEWLKQIEQMVNGTRILFWNATGKSHKDWIPLEQHGELYASCQLGLNVHRDPSINEECFTKRLRDRSMLPKGLVPCTTRPPRWGTGFWNDANLPASHINPRFFEMAACGTCVINDDARPELARMFPMAPRAIDPAQFLTLVNYYLERPQEAKEIGDACSAEILKRHTYRHRAAEILIRVGLRGSTVDKLSTSLGAQEEWLTIQDFNELGISPLLAQTGAYGPFTPHIGRSSINPSGTARSASSLGSAYPWSS